MRPKAPRVDKERLDDATLDKQTTMAKPALPGPGSSVARKLPHVTVVFWILKIAATTLGETGGDLLAQTLKVGYLTSTVIFFAMFLVSVVFQLRARRFQEAV